MRLRAAGLGCVRHLDGNAAQVQVMSDTVRVRCRTNLDGYEREEWPTQLDAVPSKGHWVSARSGKQLKICGITWCFDGSLAIELHR